MAKHCQAPGRNYCAPNGKIAALFVDVDGTISVCQPYYEEATKRFGYFMKLLGFDAREAIKLLQQIDRANTEANGFERDRFGKSMVEAYTRLCKAKRVRRKQFDMDICEDIGRSPFFREPELFANAAAVLGRAQHNFRMFAVSIGNREAQKYKVRQAGLNAVFDELIITPRDNKAKIVADVIADMNIDPRLSAFIGNSRRSDGICLQHTNFVYLPLEGGWSFDQQDLPKDTGFELFEVKDWREAEEQAIARLIRRRQAVMAQGDSPSDE
jgi:FMN phosphatase YigB (HAD superfamily)